MVLFLALKLVRTPRVCIWLISEEILASLYPHGLRERSWVKERSVSQIKLKPSLGKRLLKVCHSNRNEEWRIYCFRASTGRQLLTLESKKETLYSPANSSKSSFTGLPGRQPWILGWHDKFDNTDIHMLHARMKECPHPRKIRRDGLLVLLKVIATVFEI